MFMPRLTTALSLSGMLTGLFTGTASADENLIDGFRDAPETRWRYVADRVMGGVSTGQARFMTEANTRFVRLKGTVSTANNGGFIQVRRGIAIPDGAKGLRIRVRGHDQTYYIHLRTKDTGRPWFYYQASFRASGNWQEITLPLSAFKATGRGLPDQPPAPRVTSFGLVAYGRDHTAQVDLARISWY